MASPVIAVQDSIAVLNSTGSSVSTVHPWENITIQVTNSAKNIDSSIREAGIVTINSTSDATGIIITVLETSANSGVFEGNFFSIEGASDDVHDYIRCADGGNITVFADIDGDGSYGTTTLAMNVDPDRIVAYEDSYVHNQTHFSLGEKVYIQVFSKSGLSSAKVNISSSLGNLTLIAGESSGRYRTYITLSNVTDINRNNSIAVFGGEPVRITTDVEADGSGGSYNIYVKDLIRTYEDAYKTAETYFKFGSTVYVEVNNSLHNQNSGSIETGTVTVNSTASPSGITITVTETSANSGSFTGSFRLNNSVSGSGKLKVKADDTVKIYADLDGNDPVNGETVIKVDNTRPRILSYTKNQYKKSSSSQALRINVSDAVLMNRTAIIYYWRPLQAEDRDKDGQIDNGESASVVATSSAAKKTMYNITIDDSMLSTGDEVSFWIVAEDKAGNSANNGGNWSNPLHTYIIDNTAPTISIHGYTQDEYLTDKITLNFTYNDTHSGINSKTVYYTIKDSFGVTQRYGYLSSCTTNRCYSANLNISNITQGVMTLYANVNDFAGNTGSRSLRLFHSYSVAAYRNLSLVFTAPKTIDEGVTKKLEIVVKNTGNVNLKNLQVTVAGFNYTSNEPLFNLSVGKNKTLIVFLVNGTLGNYDVTVKVSNADVSTASSFKTKVIPNKTMRQELDKKYKQYQKELEWINKELAVLNVTNIESLKSLALRTGENIASAIADETYTTAYDLDSIIAKNIEDLKQVIELNKEPVDYGWVIFAVVAVVIIAVLAVACAS
jgi:hypothetical protein